MKPIFRWVGGKRRMIPNLMKYVPTSYNAYIEPFAGAAALFFHLEPKGKALLNDVNRDLMEAYHMAQVDPEELAKRVAQFINGEREYYAVREACPTERMARAARFLFLNRLSVNGLWRENLKGQMNAPYDHRRSNVSMDIRAEIMDASRVLNIGMQSEFTRTFITCGSYLEATWKAKTGDLVFMDPPYMPFTANGHVDYSKGRFDHTDHLELREEFVRLDKMGVHVILTNSDIPVVRDLYKGYTMESVQTKATVGRTAGQGSYGELIVSNNRILDK